MIDILLWIAVLALAVAGLWVNLTVIQIKRERRIALCIEALAQAAARMNANLTVIRIRRERKG